MSLLVARDTLVRVFWDLSVDVILMSACGPQYLSTSVDAITYKVQYTVVVFEWDCELNNTELYID